MMEHRFNTTKTAEADRRREHPRFSPDNIGKNAALLAPLEKIAAAKKCAPAQAALAWLLAQGEDVVPIPGTKRRTYLEQNCAAVNVKLAKEEIETLTGVSPQRHSRNTISREAARGTGKLTAGGHCLGRAAAVTGARPSG